MKYSINRRKFLEIFGCGCSSILLGSCSTVPITDRKQLSLISESRINAQAAQVYEKFKSKTKLITKGESIDNVKEVGNERIERQASICTALIRMRHAARLPPPPFLTIGVCCS